MKPLMLSPTVTSKPVSEITAIVHVTVEPFLILSISADARSSVNCFIPRDILSLSTSISNILAFIESPLVKPLINSSPLPSQLRSDK